MTSENDPAPILTGVRPSFREDLGSGIGGEVENYWHRKIEGAIRVHTRASHFQGSGTPYGRLCRGLLKIVQTASENDTTAEPLSQQVSQAVDATMNLIRYGDNTD